MAKLPDINYVRGVPEQRSSKMAALPGKLATINAKAQGIQGALQSGFKAYSTAIDSEAKLDSNRRLNAAKRDYITQVQDLSQEYHTDINKPMENYANDLESLREKVFTKASANASSRSSTFLGEKLDNFRTTIEPEEVAMVQKLVDSRQRYQIGLQGLDAIAAVSDNPAALTDQFEAIQETINDATLDPLTKLDMETAIAGKLADTAIAKLHSTGDVEGMYELLESELFKRLAPQSQEVARKKIEEAADEIVSTVFMTTSEQVGLGQITPDSAIEIYTATVGEIAGLDKRVADTMIKEADAAYVENHYDGLMAYGRYQDVVTSIESGEYTGRLGGEKITSYLATAQRGLKAGKSESNTILKDRASDAVAGVIDGVKPSDTLISQITAAIADENTSTTDREQLMISLNKMSVAAEYSPVINSMPGATDAELEDLKDSLAITLTTLPDTEDYRVRKETINNVVKKANQHITQRDDDAVGYAITHDRPTRESWEKFTATMGAAVAGDDPQAQLAARNNYKIYRQYVEEAQAQYGKHPLDFKLLPPDAPFVIAAVRSLEEGDLRQQIRTLTTLGNVFGEDLGDIADSLLDSNPDVAMAVLFQNTPNAQQWRDSMLRGISRSKLGDANKINSKSIAESVEGKLLIPALSVGDANVAQASTAFTTMVMGLATNEELTTGVVNVDTVKAAVQQIYGDPFTLGGYSEQSVSYRDKDTGAIVPGADVASKFRSLMIDPAKTIEGGPPTPYIQGRDGPEAISIADAIRFSTPVSADGEGKYYIDMRNSSMFGSRGYLTNEDGSRYVLDVTQMTAIPTADVRVGRTPRRWQ